MYTEQRGFSSFCMMSRKNSKRKDHLCEQWITGGCRLIIKGAAIEHCAPQKKETNETDFFSIMESIFALSSVIPLLQKEVVDK